MMSPLRRLLARLALLLCGTLIALLLAEGAVRLSGQDPLESTWQPETLDRWGGGCLQLDEDLGYANIPGECSTNALGFPDDPPAEGRRILLLGDSISAERLFPDFLEELLHRRGERIDIINTGTAGYSTVNEAALYDRHGPDLAPERVILQFCLNDYAGTPVLFEQGERVVRVRDRQGVLLGGSSWWFARSALYRLLLFVEAPALSEQSIQSRFPGTEAALHRLHARLRDEGRPLTVVVFPYLAPLDAWPRTEREAYDRILTVLADAGIDHIDLTTDFTRGDIATLRRAGGAAHHADLPGAAQTWGLQRSTLRLLERTNRARLRIPRPEATKQDPIHPSFIGHAIAAQRLLHHLTGEAEGR